MLKKMASFMKSNFKDYVIFLVTCLIVPIPWSAAKNNFRGKTTSYGIHLEANGVSTKLSYDLPSARVKASPSKDWKVTNNNAFLTSLLTPIVMTLYETHPKFDMKETWPKYKVKIDKAQKPKKRLFRNQLSNKGKMIKHKLRIKKIGSKLKNQDWHAWVKTRKNG